jgi:pantoate--beta-alanine ligase
VEVIARAAGFSGACERVRRSGGTLGLVPTMGSFHEGHLSLMRRARHERDAVAVSIFVNPLQFGPEEDFAAYPRDLDRDLALAREAGVDLVFTPQVEEMYPAGAPEVTIDPGPLGDRLEGAVRPGHFRGVCTVVARLLNLAGRSAAYFGQKDAQQLAVIRRMAADLAFPVEVVGCPIVREKDGLAMSSRNVYLTPDERRAASCLWRGLHTAAERFAAGERSAAALAGAVRGSVEGEPLASLDYAAIVDEGTFEEIERVDRPARALVAARVGRPRLIDNEALVP